MELPSDERVMPRLIGMVSASGGIQSLKVILGGLPRERVCSAVAVILPGMGADGALGMKEVRDAGGYTIVQDRANSIIYGPAEVAVRLNALCESLPVQEIAPRLISLVASGLPNLSEMSALCRYLWSFSALRAIS